MNSTQPHRWATWVFVLILPQRDKEIVLGDLIEEHALLASTLGARLLNGIGSRWSARAMLVGYLAVALLVMASDIVMSRLLPAGGLIYSLVSLAAGIPAMMLGGYLAAWIRPRAAIGLAIFSAAMGVVSVAVTGDREPLWYQIALIVTGPLAALAGGRIRNRQKDGSHA